MEDIELVAAAHHEAGHVVVAHLLNCRVDGMEVYYSDLGRWFGRSLVSLTKEDLDGVREIMQMNSLSVIEAKVAVAGMLTQATFLAIQQFGEGAQLDTSADLGAMVCFLRDNKSTEESPRSLIIGFVLGANTEKRRLELNGFDFSKEDSKAFNYSLGRRGDAGPHTLVRETIQLLNDGATWMQAKALAAILLNQPSSGKERRRVLTPDQILHGLHAQE